FHTSMVFPRKHLSVGTCKLLPLWVDPEQFGLLMMLSADRRETGDQKRLNRYGVLRLAAAAQRRAPAGIDCLSFVNLVISRARTWSASASKGDLRTLINRVDILSRELTS